jgi:hypothetical protein
MPTKTLAKTRPHANQNAKRKQLLEQRNFMQTKMLAEKGRLIFLPGLLRRKDKPILKTLQSEP